MNDSTQQYEIGQIIDGQYRLIEPISTQGGSADVWLAIDINTIEDPDDESSATRVAIKIYRRKNIIDVEGLFQFRSEFKKVFGCHHQNIIPPTYFSIFDDTPYLVLPYCPAGSSELLIGQITKAEDIWKYIYQVASGLAYLHERTPQIIHQDIKPANVLIDDNGNYAITDFGISAAIGRADIDSDDSYGTYAYMGPERFRQDAQPMPESDIWAFGATLYELMAGDTPFGNEGGENQQRNTPIPPLSKNVPEDVRSLIYACLAYDPKERPTARQIVDRVLKRRYARNRKVIIISVLAAAAITAAVLLILAGGKGDDHQARFDALCQKGDSILNVTLPPIYDNDDGSPIGDSSPIGEAIITFNDARGIPADIPDKEKVGRKIQLLEQLQAEIVSYDSLGVMIDRARRAEIEEFLVEGPIKQAQHKEKINNLISQIQSTQ